MVFDSLKVPRLSAFVETTAPVLPVVILANAGLGVFDQRHLLCNTDIELGRVIEESGHVPLPNCSLPSFHLQAANFLSHDIDHPFNTRVPRRVLAAFMIIIRTQKPPLIIIEIGYVSNHALFQRNVQRGYVLKPTQLSSKSEDRPEKWKPQLCILNIATISTQ